MGVTPSIEYVSRQGVAGGGGRGGGQPNDTFFFLISQIIIEVSPILPDKVHRDINI